MKPLISFILTLVAVVFAAVPASAGGWAVATLDSLPPATANQTVEIGFTIRQHGVTPVNPDGEVGIVLRPSTGDELFFEAAPVGPAGHYVADVTFPEAGVLTWAVRQGWFAEQDLGSLDVTSGADPGVTETYRWPAWLRFGLPALAALFGAVAIVDFAGQRRQRMATT